MIAPTFVQPTMPFPALPSRSGAPRRRPSELVYAADEHPPTAALVLLGVQHAATAMAFIAYVLVTARVAGLERADTQTLVSLTLLAMALTTALQAWGGRWGAGALLVHMPNPFMISFGASLLGAYGLGALAPAALVYGLVALAMVPLARFMRPLFPPPVVGVVICMGGMALVASSVRQALGMEAGQWQLDGPSALIAAITLGCIVALSVWGGRLRLMALLVAMCVGVALAALLGRMEDADMLRQAPLLAWPGLVAPQWHLDAGVLVAVALVAVLTQLDTLGSVIMLDKMDDADWKRADMQAVGKGIQANGLGDLLLGLAGAFPTCISSANIALVYATRSTARTIGLVAAALLALVAFLPQWTLALTLIPEPVLGAVGLYAAGFLMVSGMELTVSRALDSRALFAVGLSLCAGLAVLQMPQLAEQAPEGLRFLLGSGFVVAGVLVVALNLLFRLGVAQRAQRPLHASSAQWHADITNFVETQGAAWGARRAVVQRAALAALEAAEAIAHSPAPEGARQLVAIRGHFDEFHLDIELLHTGAPLLLRSGPATPASAALLEGDDDSALDAALAQLSSQLLPHLADRVSTRSEGPGSACLHLHFEH